MAEEADNLILTMLRKSDERMARMDEKLDRVLDDVQNLKVRMTPVEEGLAGVNRRLDRLDDRVERIEKRLDLVGSPYGGVRE